MRCLPFLLLAALLATANAQDVAPQLTGDELGYVTGITYHNDVVGLKLQQPPGWEMYTAGQMNVGEAVTGRWSQVPAAVVARHTRVLGMTDSSSAIAMVAMVKLRPADASLTLPQLAEQVRGLLMRALPNAAGRPEPVTFGDADHPFSDFRVHAAKDKEQLEMGDHLILLHGYLVQLLVVSDTPDHLTAAEKLVSAGVKFTPPKP